MTSATHNLESRIKGKRAKVAIIGLGYVGLPLAVEFAKKGVQIIGIDISQEKVHSVNSGKSYILDVSSKEIAKVVKSKKLTATVNFSKLKEADAVIVCVPTPLNRVKEPDLSFILGATEQIAKHLQKGQLIVLESTTYPGTTDEVILKRLSSPRMKVGRDFFLCFSPERIDPGNRNFPVPSIPKVVGGITPKCTRLAALLYGQVFTKVVPVSSARTAEMAKLLENTFRIVNIALVNELATIAGALGVDVWEAIDAARTKPFGYMPFYPGPGVGGHCIGIDPIYLSWKAKTHGFNVRFIDLAREINTNMPHYVVEKTQQELAKRKGKAINQAKILLMGLTYKRDVEDTRESPAFEIIEELVKLGAKVAYHDPYVPYIQFNHFSAHSKKLTGSEIAKYDMVLIVTDHTSIDYPLILKHAKLILDTRNVMKNYKNKKLIKL